MSDLEHRKAEKRKRIISVYVRTGLLGRKKINKEKQYVIYYASWKDGLECKA